MALGWPFPPLRERFEMLEETLQMAHEMWSGGSGSQGRHEGKHFTATRLLNSPQSISRPRVPIMIGGGGERKTLRLVAQYADATNVFGDPDGLRHKYAVLREHCERLGRPYEEIERSVLKSGGSRARLGGGHRRALGRPGRGRRPARDLQRPRRERHEPPGVARIRGLPAAARRVG